jgi:hypothetical protein
MIQSHGVDIRLCLNTLQFMTVNCIGKTIFTEKVKKNDFEQRLNTGLNVSFFDVLYSIFTLDFHKDRLLFYFFYFFLFSSRGIIHSPKHRANTILSLLNRLAFEEFIRIEQLLFVNFASVFKLGHEQVFLMKGTGHFVAET